jgi:hypothetical protein
MRDVILVCFASSCEEKSRLSLPLRSGRMVLLKKSSASIFVRAVMYLWTLVAKVLKLFSQSRSAVV